MTDDNVITGLFEKKANSKSGDYDLSKGNRTVRAGYDMADCPFIEIMDLETGESLVAHMDFENFVTMFSEMMIARDEF